MPSDLKFAFDQSMVATRQFGINGGTRAVVARVFWVRCPKTAISYSNGGR
jgi:hypothetical protein